MIKIAALALVILLSPLLFCLYLIGFFKHQLTNKVFKLHHRDFKYINCISILQGYQTNWLFTNPFLNTGISELFRVIRRRDIPEQYTFMLENDDGGVFSIHVYGELADDGTPTVILFHGLCGGYYASYMKSFAYAFRKSGFRVVTVNARGCADYLLNSKIFFCATHTKDHKLAIDKAHQMFPSSLLFGVGFSLGANILLHYLEENPVTPLTAGMGFSIAFNIDLVEKHLNSLIPKYTTNFVLASFIKSFLFQNRHVFGFLDWNKIRNSYTLQSLDEQVVCKVFDYPSTDAYYKAASCSRCVKHVTIPFLVVNAEDDLVCPKHTIAFAEISENPNVGLVLTKYGGHMGWCPTVPHLQKDTLKENIEVLKESPLRYLKHERWNVEPFLNMTNSWSEQVAVEFCSQFTKKTEK
eukprot:NODE_402_length_9320_cov_0.440252.p2 type:complete len:410 gc:universal NODE_402_length_9320_cov_0.440252:4635-5864(+)